MTSINFDALSLLDRPIAYHRCFAQLSGSVTAGVFLSQCFYWSKRTSDPDKWFWKTRDQWQDETCLDRREQESARKKLQQLGILEEKRVGLPAKLFYRVNGEILLKKLQDLAETVEASQLVGSVPTGRADLYQLEGRICTNYIYPENTSENTHTENPDLERARSKVNQQPLPTIEAGFEIDSKAAKKINLCVGRSNLPIIPNQTGEQATPFGFQLDMASTATIDPEQPGARDRVCVLEIPNRSSQEQPTPGRKEEGVKGIVPTAFLQEKKETPPSPPLAAVRQDEPEGGEDDQQATSPPTQLGILIQEKTKGLTAIAGAELDPFDALLLDFESTPLAPEPELINKSIGSRAAATIVSIELDRYRKIQNPDRGLPVVGVKNSDGVYEQFVVSLSQAADRDLLIDLIGKVNDPIPGRAHQELSQRLWETYRQWRPNNWDEPAQLIASRVIRSEMDKLWNSFSNKEMKTIEIIAEIEIKFRCALLFIHSSLFHCGNEFSNKNLPYLLRVDPSGIANFEKYAEKWEAKADRDKGEVANSLSRLLSSREQKIQENSACELLVLDDLTRNRV